MGLEIITQPQLFTRPITALGGYFGINEAYPLLTTYQYWTSTASVPASVWPIPGNWIMLDEPGSFIITVGGVVQNLNEYSVDRTFRTLTFVNPISAGLEVVGRQLATASPSSQNFNFIQSVSSVFLNLSGVNGQFDNLLVTNLTAVSSILQITDIQLYETSGFDVNGNINVTGNIFTNTLTAENTTLTNLTATNTNLTNLTATNLVATNLVAENTNLTATNLISENTNLTNLTATNIVLPDNGTILGATSATSISIGVLSAREIDLIHTPVNDGVDPILDIGETTTEGFSGFRVRYEESTNRLLVQTIAPALTSNSIVIDRSTGQVGISAIPNQALTVTGNISATGSIFTTAPTTLLSSSLNISPILGSIELNEFGFFATPTGIQRGIITTPQIYLLNADRVGPTSTGTFSIFGVGCNLTTGKYAYRIVFATTKTSANAAAIQYAIANFSGTIASHYYRVLGSTGASISALAAPQQMSNYVTTNFSTLSTVTIAGAAAASGHNTIIDGILDISSDVTGLNPQFGFTGIPTTSLIRAGSYIQIWPLGSTTGTNVSVGTWA